MSMTVKIVCETPDEVERVAIALCQFAKVKIGGGESIAPETPKPTTEPAQPEVTPPARKPRSKTKGAETTVQPEVEDATVVEEKPAEPPAEMTKEQKEALVGEIKGKLRTLMENTDENTVWAVLNPLGVKGATNAVETGKAAALIEALDKKLEEVGA